MITPSLILPLWNEIFVDNFAGGGGASTGIERGLGRFVDVALNHCRKALAMHRMNHPQTVHLAEDIMDADPVKIAAGRPVGGVWFSPDCKHFSKAKGGRPRSKKIRGLAWSVINWVNKVSPRVIFLENVEEFQTWCPLDSEGNPSKWRKGWFFRCFIGALQRRGYAVEWRELRACDYGAPTIRKRFFLVARRDGQPIVWPEPTHGPRLKRKHRAIAECLDFSLPCPSIFLTREEARAVKAIRPLASATMARIAKGVDRYVLKAKRPFIVELTHQGNRGHAGVDEPVKTVTAANRGEKALVAPVIAHAQHKGAVRSAEAPVHTISASTKDQNQLIACHLTKFQTGATGSPADQPAPTITANSFVKRPGGAAPIGLTAVSLVHTAHGERDKSGKKRGRGSRSVAEPSPTVTASNDGAVTACYLAQHNAGNNTNPGHPVDQPASTISTKGSQQQLVGVTAIPYYGSEDDGISITEPARTVTTRDRFGLVECFGSAPPFTPELEAAARRVAAFLRSHGVEFEGEFATVGEFVIVDIGMRMLKPRELYLAQGFPRSYVIDRGLEEDERTGRIFEISLTGTDQVRMCGNSVCPPMAEALVAANLPDLRLQEAAA